ncbi:Uncharacterized protein TCM_011969 [Theobroma cacao]|uniref:Aldehyde dehydrogenase domain-containing protein n=1 Tax=Theobroma cacao TaxID=3641 RepID=A0A061FTR5_THECC|nr:Uncharacterized protein TCM_011969 [Theobroma cacao]
MFMLLLIYLPVLLLAVEWTLYGCFYTNGQICSATSRLIVHELIGFLPFIELSISFFYHFTCGMRL